MYERFSDRARKVMQLANQEAQRFNHDYIDPEHILIALAKADNGGIAMKIFEKHSIAPTDLMHDVRALMLNGPDMVTMGKLPMTPMARGVIEQAIAAAKDLNQNYVGTEHLLIGVLNGRGTARDVLAARGLTYEKAIQCAKDMIQERVDETKSSPAPVWNVFATTVVLPSVPLSDAEKYERRKMETKLEFDVSLPGIGESATVTWKATCAGKLPVIPSTGADNPFGLRDVEVRSIQTKCVHAADGWTATGTYVFGRKAVDIG